MREVHRRALIFYRLLKGLGFETDPRVEHAFNGQTRLFGEFLAKLLRPFFEISKRADFAHQTNSEGFICVDHAAAQNHIYCRVTPDHPRQARRAAPGRAIAPSPLSVTSANC